MISELREYTKLVESVPDIKCHDCPLYSKKKTRQGGWCKPPGMPKINIRNENYAHPCFTYARLVLKMAV